MHRKKANPQDICSYTNRIQVIFMHSTTILIFTNHEKTHYVAYNHKVNINSACRICAIIKLYIKKKKLLMMPVFMPFWK